MLGDLHEQQRIEKRLENCTVVDCVMPDLVSEASDEENHGKKVEFGERRCGHTLSEEEKNKIKKQVSNFQNGIAPETAAEVDHMRRIACVLPTAIKNQFAEEVEKCWRLNQIPALRLEADATNMGVLLPSPLEREFLRGGGKCVLDPSSKFLCSIVSQQHLEQTSDGWKMSHRIAAPMPATVLPSDSKLEQEAKLKGEETGKITRIVLEQLLGLLTFLFSLPNPPTADLAPGEFPPERRSLIIELMTDSGGSTVPTQRLVLHTLNGWLQSAPYPVLTLSSWCEEHGTQTLSNESSKPMRDLMIPAPKPSKENDNTVGEADDKASKKKGGAKPKANSKAKAKAKAGGASSSSSGGSSSSSSGNNASGESHRLPNAEYIDPSDAKEHPHNVCLVRGANDPEPPQDAPKHAWDDEEADMFDGEFLPPELREPAPPAGDSSAAADVNGAQPKAKAKAKAKSKKRTRDYYSQYSFSLNRLINHQRRDLLLVLQKALADNAKTEHVARLRDADYFEQLRACTSSILTRHGLWDTKARGDIHFAISEEKIVLLDSPGSSHHVKPAEIADQLCYLIPSTRPGSETRWWPIRESSAMAVGFGLLRFQARVEERSADLCDPSSYRSAKQRKKFLEVAADALNVLHPEKFEKDCLLIAGGDEAAVDFHRPLRLHAVGSLLRSAAGYEWRFGACEAHREFLKDIASRSFAEKSADAQHARFEQLLHRENLVEEFRTKTMELVDVHVVTQLRNIVKRDGVEWGLRMAEAALAVCELGDSHSIKVEFYHQASQSAQKECGRWRGDKAVNSAAVQSFVRRVFLMDPEALAAKLSQQIEELEGERRAFYEEAIKFEVAADQQTSCPTKVKVGTLHRAHMRTRAGERETAGHLLGKRGQKQTAYQEGKRDPATCRGWLSDAGEICKEMVMDRQGTIDELTKKLRTAEAEIQRRRPAKLFWGEVLSAVPELAEEIPFRRLRQFEKDLIFDVEKAGCAGPIMSVARRATFEDDLDVMAPTTHSAAGRFVARILSAAEKQRKLGSLEDPRYLALELGGRVYVIFWSIGRPAGWVGIALPATGLGRVDVLDMLKPDAMQCLHSWDKRLESRATWNFFWLTMADSPDGHRSPGAVVDFKFEKLVVRDQFCDSDDRDALAAESGEAAPRAAAKAKPKSSASAEEHGPQKPSQRVRLGDTELTFVLLQQQGQICTAQAFLDAKKLWRRRYALQQQVKMARKLTRQAARDAKIAERARATSRKRTLERDLEEAALAAIADAAADLLDDLALDAAEECAKTGSYIHELKVAELRAHDEQLGLAADEEVMESDPEVDDFPPAATPNARKSVGPGRQLQAKPIAGTAEGDTILFIHSKPGGPEALACQQASCLKQRDYQPGQQVAAEDYLRLAIARWRYIAQRCCKMEQAIPVKDHQFPRDRRRNFHRNRFARYIQPYVQNAENSMTPDDGDPANVKRRQREQEQINELKELPANFLLIMSLQPVREDA
eukprot:g17413.t1